jgi:hypothetical protein
MGDTGLINASTDATDRLPLDRSGINELVADWNTNVVPYLARNNTGLKADDVKIKVSGGDIPNSEWRRLATLSDKINNLIPAAATQDFSPNKPFMKDAAKGLKGILNADAGSDRGDNQQALDYINNIKKTVRELSTNWGGAGPC